MAKLIKMTLLGYLLAWLFGCGNVKKARSEAQQNLDKWFPLQFEVQEVQSVFNSGNMNPDLYYLVASDKTDSDVKLYLNFDTKQPNGALEKSLIETQIQDAKNNISAARQIITSLKQKQITDLSVGVTNETIAISLFSSISETDLRPILPTVHQILADVMDKDKSKDRSAIIKVYAAEAKGQRFSEIMDKHYIRYSDDWDKKYLHLEVDVLTWHKEMEQFNYYISNARTSIYEPTSGKHYLDIINSKIDEVFFKAKEKPLRIVPKTTLHLNAENFDKVDCIFDAYTNEVAYSQKQVTHTVTCQLDLRTQTILNLKVVENE
jgi:hypothetical protein